MIFTPITAEMREAVERIRLQNGKISSAASFQSLWYWQDVQQLDICLTERMYLVRCRARGERCCYMPVGDRESVLQTLHLLAQEGAFRLCYADADDVRILAQAFPHGMQFRPERDAAEYLYDLEILSAMHGQAYSRIRKLIHRFEQNYRVTLRPISEETAQDMRQILTEWTAMQPDSSHSEYPAAARMLDSVGRMPFSGVIVYLDGAPAAAAGGFPLSDDTFDVSFVKDTRTANGLGVYARCMLAKQLAGQYRFLDAEEDLGRPGLRELKTSLHPVRMLQMWEVMYHQSSND